MFLSQAEVLESMARMVESLKTAPPLAPETTLAELLAIEGEDYRSQVVTRLQDQLDRSTT